TNQFIQSETRALTVALPRNDSTVYEHNGCPHFPKYRDRLQKRPSADQYNVGTGLRSEVLLPGAPQPFGHELIRVEVRTLIRRHGDNLRGKWLQEFPVESVGHHGNTMTCLLKPLGYDHHDPVGTEAKKEPFV